MNIFKIIISVVFIVGTIALIVYDSKSVNSKVSVVEKQKEDSAKQQSLNK